MEKRMNREELIELIESLKIDKDEFWILSSGALVIRGIYKDAGDLDIAVTDKGLEQLKANYNLEFKDNECFVVNDKVEGFVDTKEDWKIETFEGYNLENIEKYYNYLLTSTRKKDKLRIPLVEEYIKNKNNVTKKIVFATTNPSKAKRFSKGLSKNNIEILSLKDLNIELDIEENGNDAIENALIKARECYKKTNMPSIGMDDSLYLENVPNDIRPELFVRRVNGKTLNDNEMIEHYTNLVKQYGNDGKVPCKWVYGLAIINKEGNESTYTWSKDNFYMVDTVSEKINPGYPLNSISKYKVIDKYFTETTEEDLKIISVNEDHVIDFIITNI